MAYTPINWKDHTASRPLTYTKTINEDGSETLAPAFGEIIQQGTPMSAANFNHMEQGIAEAHEMLSGLVDEEGQPVPVDKLATPRKIAISGGATGTATDFDGSEDISIPVTALDPDKLNKPTPVEKGGTGVNSIPGNRILKSDAEGKVTGTDVAVTAKGYEFPADKLWIKNRNNSDPSDGGHIGFESGNAEENAGVYIGAYAGGFRAYSTKDGIHGFNMTPDGTFNAEKITLATPLGIGQGGLGSKSVMEALKALSGFAGTPQRFKTLFSDLQGTGIVNASCTTEALCLAMPAKCELSFVHNKDNAIILTDAPFNYGYIMLMKGYNDNYISGFGFEGAGVLWVYSRANAHAGTWRKVYNEASIVPLKNGGTGAEDFINARKNIHAMPLDNYSTNVSIDSFIDNLSYLLKLYQGGEQKCELRLWVGGGVTVNGNLVFHHGEIIPLENGGTGGSTAAQARTNLEITPANIGAAPALAADYTAPNAALRQAPNDLLNVSITGDFSANNMKMAYVGTDNASALVNSPISSGAFYALREVFKINHQTMVRLVESYPKPGRIWTRVYDPNFGQWLPTSGWNDTSPVGIQSGIEDNVGTSTGRIVTFAHEFTIAPVVVVSMANKAAGVWASDITKTGFKINVNASGCLVSWIAASSIPTI